MKRKEIVNGNLVSLKVCPIQILRVDLQTLSLKIYITNKLLSMKNAEYKELCYNNGNVI